MRCIDQDRLFKADITVAITTDMIIFCLPIPLIMSLSFPCRKKIRILLSLLSGSGPVIVALYKGYLVFHPKHHETSNDASWDIPLLSILRSVAFSVINSWYQAYFGSFIEITTGLMCACIPSVTILVDRIRTKRRNRNPNMADGANSAQRRHQGQFRRMARKFPGKISLGTLSTLDTELVMMSGRVAHIEHGVTTGGISVPGNLGR